jgi:putative transposase
MSYGIDYRRLVVSFVEEGGSKRDAARLFKISPNTVYEWLKRAEDLRPRPALSRIRKMDKAALRQHVQDNPDALLRERAALFGVSPVAVFCAMKKMKFVKKNGVYTKSDAL